MSSNKDADAFVGRTTKPMTKFNEAFVKAQHMIGGARKSSENPHFKSKYADLKECFNACSDILNDHDIDISQPVMQLGDMWVVRTVLTHTSGEHREDIGIPLVGWQGAKNPMQALGSAITYGRRYGLCSMVGIAPEDDDGNSLTEDKPKQDEKPKIVMTGPIKTQTELQKQFRAIVDDVQDCSDETELNGVMSKGVNVINQVKKDVPKWYDPSGDYKGFDAIVDDKIERMREES